MNDSEMKGSNYNLPRGLITTYPDFIDQTVSYPSQNNVNNFNDV